MELECQDGLEQRSAERDADGLSDVAKEISDTRSGRYVRPLDRRNHRDFGSCQFWSDGRRREGGEVALRMEVTTEEKPKPEGTTASH